MTVAMMPASWCYSEIEKIEVPCTLCGGADFEALATTDRYRMGIRTVACRGCGLLMTNPMPVPEAIDDFYRNHYRRLYRKAEGPSADYLQNWGVERRAAYTAEILEREGLLAGTRRVLDVGCGEGTILKEIGRRAPQAELHGVEPARASAAFAREQAGCAVYASLGEALGSGLVFDLIVVNHVLEHVSDPVRFLTLLRGALAPGGAVHVDVPDAQAYDSVTDLHVAHLFHFLPSTLAAVGIKAGYGVERIDSHSPPRHPISLRCVLRASGTGTTEVRDRMPREALHARLRRIDATAWRYHWSRSRLGRAGSAALRRLGALRRLRHGGM